MKIPLLLLACCLAGLVKSYSQTPIPLWQGEIPFNKKGVVVEEENDNDRVRKVTTPVLYHFKAMVPAAMLKTAVVIVPGGGYYLEAIDHEGWQAAKWFNRLGIDAFVLKYRLPDTVLVTTPHLVPLMDAQQAIALVRSRSSEFGIDPARIGIMGFSAGGHLAASASTLFHQPINKELTPANIRPDFSILMYPVITMTDAVTHRGSRENLLGKNPSHDLIQRFSLEKQVSPETPITLLVHAIDDNAVPILNSDLYADSLHKQGGDVTKVVLPKGGHGFGFKSDSEVSWWTSYLEVWLKTRILK